MSGFIRIDDNQPSIIRKGGRTILGYIKALSKNVLIYGTGRVVSPFISIVTLPILTRFFNPSDYGVIEGIATLSSVFALFSTLMLESSAQRNYYDYTDSEELERKRVISTAFWALIVWNTIFFVPILLNSRRIANLFFTEGKYGLLLLISLAAIPIISISNFLKEIFRLRNQPIKYSSFSVVSVVIYTILILLLVAVLNVGLIGYFFAGLIGGIAVFPFIISAVRKSIVWFFSWAELRKMLQFSLPLIPTNCSIWVLTLSDRFFLIKLTSLREVGLYAIGAKLTQVILLFVTAFGLAWTPFILSIYSRDKEEEKRIRGKITTYYIFVLATVVIFITVFSKFIIFLFTTKDFLDAYKVIGILALATGASGASQALCTGIGISRKTKYFAIYTALTAFLNVCLNAILVPKFGFLGSAVATAISYLILCILYYRKSQELYFSPYEPGKIVKIGILSCTLVLTSTLISSNTVVIELISKTTLFLSFFLLCFLWRIFGIHEIKVFKKEFVGMLRLGRIR